MGDATIKAITDAVSGLSSDVTGLIGANTTPIMVAVIALAGMGIGFKVVKKFIGKIG